MASTPTAVTFGAPIIMSEDVHNNPALRDACLHGKSRMPHISNVALDSGRVQQLEPGADPVKVGLQEWAVISVIPETSKGQMALKIRGCFDSPEAAGRHAAKLSDLDPFFDIYVVKMYNWLVLPIDSAMQQHIERKYKDPRLQDIMDSYKEGLQANAQESLAQSKGLKEYSVTMTETDDVDAGASGSAGAREQSSSSTDGQSAA